MNILLLSLVLFSCTSEKNGVKIPSDFGFTENIKPKNIHVTISDLQNNSAEKMADIDIIFDTEGKQIEEKSNGNNYKYIYDDKSDLTEIIANDSNIYSISEEKNKVIVNNETLQTEINLDNFSGEYNKNDIKRRIGKMIIDGTYDQNYKEERKILKKNDNSIFVGIEYKNKQYKYFYKYIVGKYIGCDEFVGDTLYGTFSVEKNDIYGNWTRIKFESIGDAITVYERVIERY
jgi:hypothetical protein